jgi:hypothetical protein
MTQDYYGTKRVTAWPEAKDGKPGYAVKYADGYTSWSPQDVFDSAYQPIDALSFGHAMEALKAGHKVRRSSWGDTHLALEKGVIDGDLYGFAQGENPNADHQSTLSGIRLGLFTCGEKGIAARMPRITHLTDAGGIVESGWRPGNIDICASDWRIVG